MLRERKPPPTTKFQPKVNRDSNPDCQINPDPSICQISSKMLWIHYFVDASHFISPSVIKKWAMTVQEMLINVLKFPIPQW